MTRPQVVGIAAMEGVFIAGLAAILGPFLASGGITLLGLTPPFTTSAGAAHSTSR